MNFIQGLIKPFKRGSSREGVGEDDLERIAALEQKVFPFQVLVSATKNFHPNHKLGEGGFGPVYKGRLSDGREIAVKKLSQSSRQGKNEFVNEAKLLAKVQHRNVVNLVGYCTHGDDKLLVYEYVSNESLDKVLFKSNRRAELDWKHRLEIITGVARGLLYLHEDAPNCIIHRDIKAGNILLDDKWVPKIADFGMARLFPEDRTHVNTRVAGTNGYMAPEYVMHGVLSVKADIFSFGVLVLELISGQKNSSFSLRHPDQTLLEWAVQERKEHGDGGSCHGSIGGCRPTPTMRSDWSAVCTGRSPSTAQHETHCYDPLKESRSSGRTLTASRPQPAVPSPPDGWNVLCIHHHHPFKFGFFFRI
ncbi:PREDICTED: putative receptor-like protein kinase At4g00960 isoform X3 [Tarenaya hassleriana]|uniref:putative receptor-like protein kinase At4g00960 isoform X3 n=1 Tax=Tarenaya hassleriana TaxID=28532 RepID=UPI00053C1CF2|nr:PREDICTED: putative receptor-like protein kinase At4g00960 isoform X3 [Tarenaya hassleriana]